jgi:hypothetical protein
MIPFFVIAGRRENLRACQSCDLDGRQPDAAGRRVDENFFTAPDFAQMMQRIPRRHERDGNRGGFLETDARRFAHDERRGNC